MLDDVDPLPEIGVGASYGNGWRQLWPNFLLLFLIGIISFLIGSVSGVLNGLVNIALEIGNAGDNAQGIGVAVAAVGGLLSFAYGILVLGPLSYGVKFVYLKAARSDPLDIKDMFEAFHNYWNAVLASLLVGVIVFIGIILLIVPGIIFGCKLAFTPYLVVDRKMEVIEAVKESWRMTRGHAWKVFFIGLLGIPIFFAGLLCFVVGIIISIMWTKLAGASLYHAVSSDYAAFGMEDYLVQSGTGI